MDHSTRFREEEFGGSNLFSSPPEESTVQLATHNTVLMDVIYGILGENGRVSPKFPTPVDMSKAKVLQWSNSLSKIQSPVEAPPSPYFDYDHSILPPRTPSPMGSLFSGSSRDSGSGPKTPTSMNHAPVVRKKFSYEKEDIVPPTPTRAPPAPPTLSVPPRISSQNRAPSPNHVPIMKATITSMVDDFMPAFIPSPPRTPVENKPPKPINLRISTNFLPYPVTPVSTYPEIKFAPPVPIAPMQPTLHIVSPVSSSIQSPTPVRALAPESSKKLLKSFNGKFSPIRQAMGLPPNKSLVSKGGPPAQNRHSMPPASSPSKSKSLRPRSHPHARPPVLSIVIEERAQTPIPPAKPVEIPVPGKTVDSRDRYHRRNSTYTPTPTNVFTEDPDNSQSRYSAMPLPSLPSKPHPIEQKRSGSTRHSLLTPTRRTQAEIEAIPTPVTAKIMTPASFGTDQGVWFTKRFFTGELGMQFTMSRRVITTSKMEWVTEGTDGSQLLKCYEQTNSLSRKKDFFDVEGNPLFDFQRRTGSTRTAESPKGTTLFAVKNASLHMIPHWTVNLTDTESTAAQWVATGDEKIKNVTVTWGGFQVGHISCESKRRHSYSVSIAPEMNYAIMAALVTVFDDLKTDEGY